MLFHLVYMVAVVGLVLVGVHRLVLMLASCRAPRLRPRPASAEAETALPCVTVQLPVYNERFVVAELLEAVSALEYPRDRLQVQVLDDSNDSTTEVVASIVERLRSRGLEVQHLRRPQRTGFKGGALAWGLERARGDLVAIFDADFLPPPELLLAIVPHFADPKVGLVQARWAHTNRGASLLTRAQALQLDGHFLVEHLGREAAGVFLNFNGTAGVLRRQAIEQAGGWHWDTLTEDLDLSCRAQLAGWRFVYRPDLLVPAQLPESLSAYKSQQRRWTRGSVQTARKLMGPVWRSPASMRTKLEASALLLGNASYVLLFVFAVLHGIYWAPQSRESVGALHLWDTWLLGGSTAVLWLFYAAAAARAGRGALTALFEVPWLIALGAGMALNNGLAFLQGLFGGTGTFHRTPKSPPVGSGVEGAGDGTWLPVYQASAGASILFELPLAFGALWCAAVFLSRGWFGSAFFYLLFCAGLSYVGFGSLLERLRDRRPRAASKASPAATAPYSSPTTQALSCQTPVAR